MSSRIPDALRDAAAAFDELPGIGPRAALRYAYWLATQSKERIRRIAQAILQLTDRVVRCHICNAWSDGETCSICSDPTRDASVLCVVATSQDLHVIEDSGGFKGRYHVLGGLLDPIEGRTPETIDITGLLRRVREANGSIREIILAFDPDVSGDTTALYLSKQLANEPVTISRLARGLPTGAQIEYADGATVADALANRRKTR